MAVPVQRVTQGTETARPVQGQQIINADPASFGALEGASLQNAGAKVEQVSDTLERRALIMATEDNEAAAKTADATVNDQLRTMLFDPASGYFTKKGADAVGAYKPTMEAVQKVIDAQASTLQTPDARRMFLDAAARRRDTTLNSMAQHAAIERRGSLDAASFARADGDVQNSIAYGQDPVKREAFLNIARNEILTFGKDHGEPPEVTAQKLRASDTKAYAGIIQNVAGTDPLAAAKLYEEVKPKINGEARAPLESFLKVKTEKYQATSDANTAMGTGATADYGTKIGAYENGGSYGGAPNAASGASGKFQFIRSTGLEHARKADIEGTLGKSDDEVMALLRSDTPEGRALQGKTLSHFTRENEGALKDAGQPVNDATRYLAHQYGAAGAINILKADPSTPIEKFLPSSKGADGKTRTPDQWAEANGVKGMTAGQVVSLATQRMGTATTKLPDEGGIANAPTSTDPKATLAAIQQNFATYVAAAQTIEDPARRDNAIAELRRRLELQSLQVSAQSKAYTAQAWKIAMTPTQPGSRGPVSQDAIPADLWVQLDPEVQRSLLAQFDHNAKGTKRLTDMSVFYPLEQMAGSQPGAFAQVDLMNYHDKLSDDDFKHLSGLQSAALGRDPTAGDLRDKHAIVRDAARAAGLKIHSASASPSEQTATNNFLSWVEDAGHSWAAQNGRKPNGKEWQAIVDGVTMKIPSGSAWSGDKPIYEMTIDDIPKAAQAQFMQTFASRGAPAPSDHDIIAMAAAGRVGAVPASYVPILAAELKKRGRAVTPQTLLGAWNLVADSFGANEPGASQPDSVAPSPPVAPPVVSDPVAPVMGNPLPQEQQLPVPSLNPRPTSLKLPVRP